MDNHGQVQQDHAAANNKDHQCRTSSTDVCAASTKGLMYIQRTSTYCDFFLGFLIQSTKNTDHTGTHTCRHNISYGCFLKWWYKYPQKHLKMIISSRKTPWLLGTTILGTPYISYIISCHENSLPASANHRVPRSLFASVSTSRSSASWGPWEERCIYLHENHKYQPSMWVNI